MKTYDSKEGDAKSIIHIFLPGGMAHQESFDPKPLRPDRIPRPVRHDARRSSTAKSSARRMPKTAKIADKITVIRSMTHGEAAHERGTHNMFTGYRPSPALQYPSMGSVVAHEFGPRNNLPPYVCVPSMPNDYAGSGYLSARVRPVQPRRRPGRRQASRCAT